MRERLRPRNREPGERLRVRSDVQHAFERELVTSRGDSKAKREDFETLRLQGWEGRPAFNFGQLERVAALKNAHEAHGGKLPAVHLGSPQALKPVPIRERREELVVGELGRPRRKCGRSTLMAL